MSQSVQELGQGRLWAIDRAQLIVAQMGLQQGLGACATHVEVGTETFLCAVRDGSTHIRTCGKFVVDSETIVNEWEASKGGKLPVAHLDFARSLGNYRYRGRLYDPSGLTPDAAVNHFRVVRLVLPELLRAHRPSVAEAGRAGLTVVKDKLETANRHMPSKAKSPSRQTSSGGGWGSY